MAFGDFPHADKYIDCLNGMLSQHCPQAFRLICFTDRRRNIHPDIEQRDCSGWNEFDAAGMPAFMRKLGLFNPAYVEFDEYWFLDLTLIIRSSMQPLLSFASDRQEDLVLVQDWHHACCNSSVMRIRPRQMRFIYDAFIARELSPFEFPGDQDFIHAIVAARGEQHRVALLPDGMVISFKHTVRIGRRDPTKTRAVFEAATIVKFHGRPRMHQVFNPIYRLFRIRLRDLSKGRWHRPVSPAELRELQSHWRPAGSA
jgi:hypothetical protein